MRVIWQQVSIRSCGAAYGFTSCRRWLTGRRGDENWDAYEAPDGETLVARAQAGVAWPVLRRWLQDLSKELVAAERDGTMPLLALERLWVRADGRLVLADFPVAHGRQQSSAPCVTPVGLLAALASNSLKSIEQDPAALPLSARALLRRLDAAPPPSIQDAHGEIARWVSAPDRVDSWRRGIPIGAPRPCSWSGRGLHDRIAGTWVVVR